MKAVFALPSWIWMVLTLELFNPATHPWQKYQPNLRQWQRGRADYVLTIDAMLWTWFAVTTVRVYFQV